MYFLSVLLHTTYHLPPTPPPTGIHAVAEGTAAVRRVRLALAGAALGPAAAPEVEPIGEAGPTGAIATATAHHPLSSTYLLLLLDYIGFALDLLGFHGIYIGFALDLLGFL